MKRPHRRGTAISPKRIAEWIEVGRFYRHPLDVVSIQHWLKRFSKADLDIAARVSDCVQVVSEQQIHLGYRDALRRLRDWDVDPVRRRGQWLFVGFGGPGESGQAMLRIFREANQMTSQAYNSLFCGATDLPFKELTAADHVVFIDDFSGTGRQVCVVWPTLQELIAADASCHLILTAATHVAISKIRKLINLTLMVHFELQEEDNIFSAKCKYFNKAEKLIIEEYGKRADRKKPKGFGECGLLFVLSHKTPNNTVPILSAYHDRWHGLYPRYLPPLP